MATRGLHTYNPRDVSVIINGVALDGFSDGSIVSVEKSEPLAEIVTGADGQNTRIVNASTVWSATVSLAQSSSSNDVLSVYLLGAKNTRTGGTFVLLVKDNSGRTLISDGEAFLSEAPAVSFSDSGEDREWVIMLPNPKLFIGGNVSSTGSPALPSIPGVSLPF